MVSWIEMGLNKFLHAFVNQGLTNCTRVPLKSFPSLKIIHRPAICLKQFGISQPCTAVGFYITVFATDFPHLYIAELCAWVHCILPEKQQVLHQLESVGLRFSKEPKVVKFPAPMGFEYLPCLRPFEKSILLHKQSGKTELLRSTYCCFFIILSSISTEMLVWHFYLYYCLFIVGVENNMNGNTKKKNDRTLLCNWIVLFISLAPLKARQVLSVAEAYKHLQDYNPNL